jgi:hypothetical protein
MADLDVRPKKRGSVWPWILLLIIIALAAYLFMNNRDDIKDAVDGTNRTDSTVIQDTSAP